jgi:hypothetical protein
LKIAWFLLVALAIMALCLGLGGGLLLPALGVEGELARMIPAGVGGACIGLLYILMFRRPTGA